MKNKNLKEQEGQNRKQEFGKEGKQQETRREEHNKNGFGKEQRREHETGKKGQEGFGKKSHEDYNRAPVPASNKTNEYSKKEAEGEQETERNEINNKKNPW